MTNNYNENKIREAAYFNWQNAGCPSGKDEYFWNMAINQLYGSCKSASCCKSSSKSSSKTASTAKTSSSKKTSSAKKK